MEVHYPHSSDTCPLIGAGYKSCVSFHLIDGTLDPLTNHKSKISAPVTVKWHVKDIYRDAAQPLTCKVALYIVITCKTILWHPLRAKADNNRKPFL